MGTDQQHQQSLNRRGFLQASGAFALMVGLSGKRGMLAASGLTPKRSIADLHFADFDALVGQPFYVNTAAVLPLSVQLVAVEAYTSPATQVMNPRQEWFSLAFIGPKGQAFPQGTYTFAHPKLGSFDLFVVPTMAVDYEERHIAIINRV